MLFPPGKLTKRYGFPWKWSLNSGLVMTFYDFLRLFHISISCRAYPDSGHHFSQLLVPAARSGRGTCLQRRLWAKTGCRSQNGRGPKSSPWFPANMDVIWCNMMQQVWNPTISVKNVVTCWDMLRYSLKGTQGYLKMRTAWPSSPTLFAWSFAQHAVSQERRPKVVSIEFGIFCGQKYQVLISRSLRPGQRTAGKLMFLSYFAFILLLSTVIWVCHNSGYSTTAWTPWPPCWDKPILSTWLKNRVQQRTPKIASFYMEHDDYVLKWFFMCGLILRDFKGTLCSNKT